MGSHPPRDGPPSLPPSCPTCHPPASSTIPFSVVGWAEGKTGESPRSSRGRSLGSGPQEGRVRSSPTTRARPVGSQFTRPEGALPARVAAGAGRKGSGRSGRSARPRRPVAHPDASRTRDARPTGTSPTPSPLRPPVVSRATGSPARPLTLTVGGRYLLGPGGPPESVLVPFPRPP